MSFKAFRGNAFSHTHENLIFNELHDLLEQNWAASDEPIFLIGNFYVRGCELDALILKRNALIVVDFKNYGGKLELAENGPWKIDGQVVKGGSKPNPFIQIRDNRNQLRGYLNENVVFDSSPELGHIAGLCLFHQETKYNKNELSHPIRSWFHISDISHAIRTIDAIVSTKINLSENELTKILSAFAVPEYTPDGRSVEVPIGPYNEDFDPIPERLNGEQIKALNLMQEWMDEEVHTAFALSGAAHTGLNKTVKAFTKYLRDINKQPIFLAPNARVASRYNSSGFKDVSSVFQWIFAKRPNEIVNGKNKYPIKAPNVDIHKDIIIILESHLLSNDHFETETAVYGSGFLVNDLIEALSSEVSIENEVLAEPNQTRTLPKILIVGDSYQLTRGARDKSLLTCQELEQMSIRCLETELRSQDRHVEDPSDLLDFQNTLIGQLKAQKFLNLPVCKSGFIKQIERGEKTEEIIEQLFQWPRNTVYLTATNEAAHSINKAVRARFPDVDSRHSLAAGDLIDIHNRTPNTGNYDFDQIEQEWVNAGEIALVTTVGDSWTRSQELKGREQPVTIEFNEATIRHSRGTSTIFYIVDYMSAMKPELTQDQSIALQIWAKKEASEALADKKNKLDSMDASDPDYPEAKSRFDEELNNKIMTSKYTNAARIRYAYAMTVHRSQIYEQVPNVVLDGHSAHDTSNPATDSYFRWLYTATTRAMDSLEILNYPNLTPISQAVWKFDQARLVPITDKTRFFFDKDRRPSDDELASPSPTGFSNPDARLVALFLTIQDQLSDSDWRVEAVSQNNYKDSYSFAFEESLVQVDFNYNQKFEVSVGKPVVKKGAEAHAHQLIHLLSTQPRFIDPNVEIAVNQIRLLLSEKSWAVHSIDEKPYKVYVVAEHPCGKVKLELNVPATGNVSSINLVKADTKAVADVFKTEFSNV